MDKGKEIYLKLRAEQIREQIIVAIESAKSGHVGGSLSVAEILSVLYFDKMNINPKDSKDGERDRFVLSKGHCTPAMYATLALRGYFPKEDLKFFRGIDSYLSGHVEMTKVPGVDMSAGSLGQGLSAAVGMAVAGKMYHKKYRVFAIVGDGEIEEGQVWEAFMAAGNYYLDNLTVFIDNNNLQIDGAIEDIMSPYPIDEKLKAFKWNVITIDGHDPREISNAIESANDCSGRPTVIIAKTVKGKGVSFMENQVGWHGKVPNEQQFKQAKEEIKERIAELEARR